MTCCVQSMPEMVRISGRSQETLTEAAAAELAAAEQPTALSLVNISSWQDTVLDGVMCTDHVSRVLKLKLASGTHITDSGLASLQRLNSLEDVSLILFPHITADGVRQLAASPSVQRIELKFCAKVSASACHNIEAEENSKRADQGQSLITIAWQ